MAGLQIIGRDEWGARKPRSRTGLAHSGGVHVHHTTGATLGHTDLSRWVRNIQDFHLDDRGWADIAYSFLVGWDDDDDLVRIFVGRGWGIAGAHTEDWNHNSHGIALLGTGDRLPPAPVLDAFAVLVGEHDRRFGAGYVLGHRDRKKTGCPGDALYAWVHGELPLRRGGTTVSPSEHPIVTFAGRVITGWGTPSGRGYTILSEAGEIATFGDAVYAGRVEAPHDQNPSD